MSDGPVDRCKARFEASRERLRNALLEPPPELAWCEARAQLQSLSPDDLRERFDDNFDNMNASDFSICILARDPRGPPGDNGECFGVRQFEESANEVVFLIYEAIDRELEGGPLEGGGPDNPWCFRWQLSVSDWRKEVRDLLDRYDSEVLRRCTGPAPQEPLDAYEGARATIYRRAFQTYSHAGLLGCETAHRLETMSQEALDMLFDFHMKKLYFDANHNILGRHTKEDSEGWFLELCAFSSDASTVIWLIFEALDREAAGTAERVSKWREELRVFLYRTQSCGRPCFHAGIVPEDPTFDSRYPFPCDEEHHQMSKTKGKCLKAIHTLARQLELRIDQPTHRGRWDRGNIPRNRPSYIVRPALEGGYDSPP